METNIPPTHKLGDYRDVDTLWDVVIRNRYNGNQSDGLEDLLNKRLLDIIIDEKDDLVKVSSRDYDKFMSLI